MQHISTCTYSTSCGKSICTNLQVRLFDYFSGEVDGNGEVIQRFVKLAFEEYVDGLHEPIGRHPVEVVGLMPFPTECSFLRAFDPVTSQSLFADRPKLGGELTVVVETRKRKLLIESKLQDPLGHIVGEKVGDKGLQIGLRIDSLGYCGPLFEVALHIVDCLFDCSLDAPVLGYLRNRLDHIAAQVDAKFSVGVNIGQLFLDNLQNRIKNLHVSKRKFKELRSYLVQLP